MVILSDSEIYIDELKDDTVGYADGRTYVVRDGSTAVSNNKIMDGGSVRVEGQKVIGITIYSNGLLYAMNASALYNVVSNGGQLNVGMSGYAEGNIIAAGGSMYIGPYTIAVSNYIQDGGSLFASDTATVSDNIVLNGGIITVSDDAIANNNTIGSGGAINLVNGGTASGNKITVGGKVNVFYRGGATNNNVQSGAIITVNNGGSAVNNNVLSAGMIDVSSGGLVLSNVVSAGGNIVISSGGSAVWNILSGGNLTANNAYLDNNIINSGGTISAFGGGIAQDTSVNAGGTFYLGSNGNALRTTIEDGGILSANYATVTSAIINSGGVLDAGFGDSGTGDETTGRIITKVNNASVNAGGILNISKGIATGNVINGGTVNVYDFASLKGTIAIGGPINLIGGNGIVQGVFVGNGTILNVSAGLAIGNNFLDVGTVNAIGGNVSGTVFSNGAILNVSVGANVIDNTILSGATLDVSSGGIARDNHISYGGTIKVASGGTALNNDVASGGNFIIDNGGSAFGNTLQSGANFVVNSGGVVTSNIVSSGGVISVGDGGITSAGTISGGTIIASAGATVVNNTVAENGKIIVYPSGNALNNTINVGGNLTVYGGGSAIGNNIAGGDLTAMAGATLAGNSAFNGGVISATGGGIIKDTYIGSGGILHVTSNRTASGNIVDNSGTIYVNSAQLIGNMVNSGGAITTGYGEPSLVGDGKPNIVISATINQGGILNISNGKAAGNIINGGTVNIYDAGNLYGTIVSSVASAGEIEAGDISDINAGTINLIGSTGTAKGIEVGTDTVLNVYGGYAVGNNVLSGGTINAIGGMVSHTTISNGADLNVSAGATASENNIASGGTIVVSSGGLALSNHLSAGANLVIENGGSAFGNILQSGANFIVSQGALVSAGTVGSGGMMSISDGGTIQDMTIQSGGSAVIEKGAKLDGTIVLEGGGYLAITDSTGGTVSFADTTIPLYLQRNGIVSGSLETGLVISGDGPYIDTKIEGFSGTGVGNSDKIILADINPTEVQYVIFPDEDHVLFHLPYGGEGLFGRDIILNIVGVGNLGYSLRGDGKGGLIYEVCFLTGTLISVADGLCAVEDIHVGDKVISYNPQTRRKSQRKVTWVGKKTAHVKQVGLDDEAGYPVRILKNAIADNVPNKDLLVTPEHWLFFDGHFTPARMLVNGRSIYYDRSLTTYDYYHIETEKHSVIMADGMLTESYLDTGNRHSFVPKEKIVSLKGKSWDRDAAAPLVVERSVVEPLYREIETRADVMGCQYQADPVQSTTDANLCLITDKGQVISDDLVSQDGKVVFIIPAHTKSVRITSRVGRPSTMIGPFVDDRRYLGLLVGEMQVFYNGSLKEFNLHTQIEALEGWDIIENQDCRWTKGSAFLPLDELGDFDTPIYLSIQILGGGPYFVEQDEQDEQDEHDDQKQLA